MKSHRLQALLFLLNIPLIAATVRGRSSSSSSKSDRDPRTSNDAHAVTPPNCAAFCSQNIDREWSSSIRSKKSSSSSSSSADDSKRSCCRGGLIALKMMYHGEESGAEFYTAIHALEEATAASTSLHIVEPCDKTTAKSDSKDDDDAAPANNAVFVDCARCFPDATADNSCAGTVNITVNSGDWVCLHSREGKLPTNVRLFYRPSSSSNDSTCPVFAADLHTSCSRPILPPFAMLLGDDAPACDRNKDSPLVDLENANYEYKYYRDSSYLQFIDGVSFRRPGALLSACAENAVSDPEVHPNARDDDDHHRCCRGGVSFLKLQFYGGTFNVSGTLALPPAANLTCPKSERRALGRSEEKSSKRSSEGKSKTSPSSSKTKGSVSSKRRSLSLSRFSARSKLTQSSNPSSSSKGSSGASTPSVAFIDCESECLSTASENADGMALRGRALSSCDTFGNQQAVKPGTTICLVSLDDSGEVSLQSKMPTNLPLYLTPDDQFASHCVQRVILHTSCSKPIEAPFSLRFTDACKDEPSSAVIRPKHTSDDVYLDFVDGLSVDFARASVAGLDYSFASCGLCDCGNGPIPSVSPTLGMESSTAPSSDASGLLPTPPVVDRDDEPSGAPQAGPTLTTSSSPSQKPNGASEIDRDDEPSGAPQAGPTLTMSSSPSQKPRPSTPQSTDSPAPYSNKADSIAPSVEKQEPSSVPSSSDCETLCESYAKEQCIITDSADRPVSEPCRVDRDWESLLERFLSNELSIENQIRRRSLIVAALATTQARLSAALSDP